MTERSGSYPLMNMAEDFGLPLDVVYCAAWSLKKIMSEKCSKDHYWSGWAIKELQLLGEEKSMAIGIAIADHIIPFVELQGSAL